LRGMVIGGVHEGGADRDIFGIVGGASRNDGVGGANARSSPARMFILFSAKGRKKAAAGIKAFSSGENERITAVCRYIRSIFGDYGVRSENIVSPRRKVL